MNSKGSGICNSRAIIEIISPFLRTILYLISIRRICYNNVNSVRRTIICLCDILGSNSHGLIRDGPFCRGCAGIVPLTCNGNDITALIYPWNISWDFIIIRTKHSLVSQFHTGYHDGLLQAVILKLRLFKRNLCTRYRFGSNGKFYSFSNRNIIIVCRQIIIRYLYLHVSKPLLAWKSML